MKARQEQTIESEQSMIPNTQIESMFMRVCNDAEMEKYVKLCDDGHISLATAYASNKVYKLFYALIEEFESKGGTVEDLTKKKKLI